VINLDKEPILSVTMIAKQLGVSRSGILAWMDEGRKSVRGERVCLESAMCLGGTRGTSIEAVRRFHRRLNGSEEPTNGHGTV
jgi:hypothetical protein